MCMCEAAQAAWTAAHRRRRGRVGAGGETRRGRRVHRRANTRRDGGLQRNGFEFAHCGSCRSYTFTCAYTFTPSMPNGDLASAFLSRFAGYGDLNGKGQTVRRSFAMGAMRLAGTASPHLRGAPHGGAGEWAQVAKRGGDAASTLGAGLVGAQAATRGGGSVFIRLCRQGACGSRRWFWGGRRGA
jgi:hypothetical protein